MRRSEIINKLIEDNNYKSYLEIGVDNPNNCFNHIVCQEKVGVDPVKGGTVKATSDAFFEANKMKFDIVFIDGYHEQWQAIRDIANSLKVMKPRGRIVVHDLCPKNELMQKVPREARVWTGDVWKAWAYYRAKNKNLKMVTIDTDYGVGIIKKGRQILYCGNYETYEDYINNRENILNLKTAKEVFGVH